MPHSKPTPETERGRLVEVILVDELDNELGAMEKLEAHRLGVLHRAFSVFLFNREGELLMQRRSEEKYHSPGLWTNTCCSHPKPGEVVLAAAHRRLQEEMGMTAEVSPAFTVLYRAEFPNGLVEHELDHVLIGSYDGEPRVDPSEVGEWKYAPRSAIEAEVEENPERFTPWFKLILPRLKRYMDPRP